MGSPSGFFFILVWGVFSALPPMQSLRLRILKTILISPRITLRKRRILCVQTYIQIPLAPRAARHPPSEGAEFATATPMVGREARAACCTDKAASRLPTPTHALLQRVPPLNRVRLRDCARMSCAVLRHSGGFQLRRLLMDTQTVIAVCEVLLVIIGIIGLALVRRE